MKRISRWISIDALPDLSQPFYSSLSGAAPDSLLAHFEPSLRMLHRLGSSYELQFRLGISFDPMRVAGGRLQIALGFSGESRLLEAAPIYPTWVATPLAPFFAHLMAPAADWTVAGVSHPKELSLVGCEVARMERYWPLADLGDESFVRHSDLPEWLHAVYPWEGNGTCRLMSALQLMQALDEPCAITLALTPSEGETEYEALSPLYATSLARLAGGSQKDALGRTDFVKPGPVAEQLRSLRQELLDKLRCEPCFSMQLRCYAQTRDTARLLADTVMAEAVSEGPHASWPLPADLGFFEPAPVHLVSLKPPAGVGLPPALQRLPGVFALSEVSSLFRLPVLYEGEQLDLRKETWPSLPAAGQRQVLLGHMLSAGKQPVDPVHLPLDALVKHTLVVGVPGSGKTNTLLSLARQLWVDHQVSFLVLEPAKREYRGLLNLPGCAGQVLLFAPGRAAAREWLLEGEFNALALRINPLEMPLGYSVGEHCAHLQAIFDAAFGLFNPLPAMLESALETAYVERGWRREDIASAAKVQAHGFPSMGRLVELLRELADATDYVGENAATVKAGLEYRFGRLVDGALAEVFGTATSTLRPEEWLTRPVVVELESLGEASANLMSLLLQTYLREALTVQQEASRQAGSSTQPGHKLRHVLFLEEAHNLIGTRSERSGVEGQGDAKAAATAFVIKMLAEVRALGLGIVIGDQLPSALAPEVLKNTSVRICHRLTAPDDRAQMQHSMNASDLQLELMATQTSGQALVSFEGIRKPFAMHMLAADGDLGRHNAAISDQALLMAVLSAAPGRNEIDERFSANAQNLLTDRWQQLKRVPWRGLTPAELVKLLASGECSGEHLLLAELMREWLAATVRCAARLQLWLRPVPTAEQVCRALGDRIERMEIDLKALAEACSALREARSGAWICTEIGRRFDPTEPLPADGRAHLDRAASSARWWYERALQQAAAIPSSSTGGPEVPDVDEAKALAHFGLWRLSTSDKSRRAALQTNRQRNMHHLNAAATLRLPKAMLAMGLELLPKDGLTARCWIRRAADAGYPPAAKALRDVETQFQATGEQ